MDTISNTALTIYSYTLEYSYSFSTYVASILQDCSINKIYLSFHDISDIFYKYDQILHSLKKLITLYNKDECTAIAEPNFEKSKSKVLLNF